MEFKIEKGVPIPQRRTLNKYPLTTMEIGDSFAAPSSLKNSLHASAAHMRRRYQKKFRIAPIKDDPQYPDHIRMWRVE
jgi:hypothetical protein